MPDASNREKRSRQTATFAGSELRAMGDLLETGKTDIPPARLPGTSRMAVVGAYKDGTVLGGYYADLFVENQLIVELKACTSVIEEHIAQLLGYLTSSRIETGLLINFGSAKLHVKKYLTSHSQ
jgi:GxxExxY protein